MNKEQIFRKLYDNQVTRDAWFDRLPKSINMAFVDNPYVNNLIMEREMFTELVFGEHTAAVEWFLYDWRPGLEVGCNGVTAKINNIDEYISYLKKNEGFE